LLFSYVVAKNSDFFFNLRNEQLWAIVIKLWYGSLMGSVSDPMTGGSTSSHCTVG